VLAFHRAAVTDVPMRSGDEVNHKRTYKLFLTHSFMFVIRDTTTGRVIKNISEGYNMVVICTSEMFKQNGSVIHIIAVV